MVSYFYLVTLSQNSFCVFPDEFGELVKIILFKTVLYVLIRVGNQMKAVNAYGSVVAKEEHENPCEFIPRKVKMLIQHVFIHTSIFFSLKFVILVK